MEHADTITYISISVIVVSLFFIGIELTGMATTDTGIVNVTIDTSASIIFSSSLLDFGNGTITPGQTAIVNSESTNNGNWSGTAPSAGLILQNNGNVNVSFTLRANKTADEFLGGTTPAFKVKVSDEEAGSCNSVTNFTTYSSITTSDQLACTNFGFNSTYDSVSIDVELTMNADASGAKTVGIIATATTTL